MTEIRAFISGVAFGITKKLTARMNRALFTKDEWDDAHKTIGQLYECSPIDDVVSDEGISKLQDMWETGDTRGIWKLARDEIKISNRPWCIDYVVKAVHYTMKCVPDIVYEATTNYLYGGLK